MRILLSGSDAALNDKLACYLEFHGNTICTALSGGQLFRKMVATPYDILLFDNDSSRIDLSRAIDTARSCGAEVVVLARASRVEERVNALLGGAADFIEAASDPAEILARLSAIVRRRNRNVLDTLCVGDLCYTASTQRATRAGQPLDLHPTACRLLEALMRNSPGVVWREELESIVWNNGFSMKGSLRAQIHIIRSAVDKPFATPLVHSINGIGYRIGADALVA